VHEVAVGTSCTVAFIKLTTTSFAELRDWRVLRHHQSSTVVTTMQSLGASLRLLFARIFDIDIAEHVVAKILHHVELFDFPVLGQFFHDLLIEVLKVGRIINWLTVRAR